MDKEFLERMGVTPEQADEILKQYKQYADEKEAAESAVQELRESLASLQKTTAEEKEALERELASVRLSGAIDAKLAHCGARSIKAVRGMLDFDTLSLDGDSVSGLDEQLEEIKRDAGFLFSAESPASSGIPHETGTPSSGDAFISAARLGANLH